MRLLTFIIDTIRHVVETVDAKIDAIQVASISDKLEARAADSDAKNWKTSVVDLMKLAGLDPLLANRRELAAELGHQGKFTGSIAENMWLHSKLIEALAEREIKLPRK